ncbi:transposase [Streptomyces sp. NPDC057137]|uniref:transposase n=1 Tax=Streptomyces sp. NPDC057137 TaxID=3346030 RepID=UPI0036354591
MEQGYSTREAAGIVGINLRTGKRWRDGRHSPPGGRRAVPPVRIMEEPPSASRYLTEAERIRIADRLRENASIRRVAADLGRSPSTISREIRRNRRPMPNEGWTYRPFEAEIRRLRPKAGKSGQNIELREFIQDHLMMRWSPEQICWLCGHASPTCRRCT